MPIPTYTPGYPPDGSSLGQTKAVMRNNLDGTFQTLNVDHINNNGQPGTQPAGYHTIIHEVSQTSVNTISGYNQVFSGVPGTLVVNAVTTPTIPSGGDTQLYSLSGAGVLSQLTGKSASANGYAWVGGILIQWGSNNANDGTSISFPVTFPNNCFQVNPAVIRNVTSTVNVIAYVGSKNQSAWVLRTNLGSGPLLDTTWIAIGN